MSMGDKVIAFLVSTPIIVAAVAFIVSIFALPVIAVFGLAKLVFG